MKFRIWFKSENAQGTQAYVFFSFMLYDKHIYTFFK